MTWRIVAAQTVSAALALAAVGCGDISSTLEGWNHHYNSPSSVAFNTPSGIVTAHGVVVDSKGEIAFTGLLEKPVVFGTDQIGGTGKTSMFLVKLRQDGSLAWNLTSTAVDAQAAITGHALAVDAEDNLYVAGGRFGQATLGGADPLPPSDNFSGYVAKYDTAGKHVWDIALDSFGGADAGFVTRPLSVVSLAARAGQGLALVAQCQNGARLGDIELASSGKQGLCVFALDFDGKPLWGTRMDASYEVNTPSARVAIDASGNVLVGGMVGAEGFVRKFDASGREIWFVRFGEGEQSFDGLAVDAAGNAFVAGSRVAGGVDRHLAKITPDGKMLWERGVDGIVGVDVDATGNLVIASAEAAGQYDYRPVFITADADGKQISEAFVDELWLPTQVRWYGDGSFVTCGNRPLWPEIVVARQRFVNAE